MAVARMTKAQVVIHGAASEAVVKRIYDLGIIQAIQVSEKIEEEKGYLQNVSEKVLPQIAELESRLREVNRSLEILAIYDDSSREIIENFVNLKQCIPRQRIETVPKSFDYSEISQQLVTLTENLKHLQDQEEWLQDDIELLNTLKAVPFPLSDLRSLSRAKTIIGRLRKEAKDSLIADLSKNDDRVYWEEITEEHQCAYMLLVYVPPGKPAQEGEEPGESSGEQVNISDILERHGFEVLDLSPYSLKIPKEIQRLTQELADVRKQSEEVKHAIRSFLPYQQNFKIVEDYLVNEINRHKQLQNFAGTKKVYFVEGWMKQSDRDSLETGLQEFKDDVEIFYSEPEGGDKTVPVILENKPYIQPFEVITRMFGMPKYWEPDPTPILAPFFIVSFGLCLTDAGYGILLALLMWWLIRKYIFDMGTLRLARLLLFGGIATLILGAMTGGWFGNILDTLPWLGFVASVKDTLIVIDPIKEPIAFLVMALILGYIQVCYGIYLKMNLRMQQGDKNGALLDEGIWLVFINSLFFLLIIAATGIGHSPIGKGLNGIVKTLVFVSGAVRICFYGRANTNIVKRILTGILSLYDIVGIFSDVLSYSRLLALGLATGVIAMIIDMLTMMISNVPVIGILLGIILFCVGHVFNLVINTLGAFIHSGRLQFVEFFSKFFESGGKKYQPFKFESKYFELGE